MTTLPFVSVIISTFNRSDALISVLEGLALQTDAHFEVIIADDGSRTEHLNAVLNSSWARLLKVTHVWHPDIGFTLSRIRNRGVAASRGEYIVFIDGDCIPARDFIARQRGLAQRGFFVNGSRVLLSNSLSCRIIQGQEKIAGRRTLYWLKQRILGGANKWGGSLRLPDLSIRVHRGTPWVGVRGGNMSVWRQDFEHVDGFDESFVGWGHEDADFVLRLTHAGIRRKNGFLATEVFHLWHKEAARSQASLNATTVLERVQTNITRSTLGYSQKRPNDDVVITRLG